MTSSAENGAEITIRPLREDDLAAADRVLRLAFGTFIGIPDPETCFGDADYVYSRWQAAPENAFAAEMTGHIVGSVFVTRWGSFGSFGPLTIRPDLWNRGIGGRLLEPVVERLRAWDVSLAGLFTSVQSVKNLTMYQHRGFRPRFLTAVLQRAVPEQAPVSSYDRFSQLPETGKSDALKGCCSVTDALFEGLDVGSEIQAIEDQGLGDTLLVRDEGEIVAFAACHEGAGTEAGSGVCYVKFAAVRPGPKAPGHFDRLLDCCESFAANREATRMVAGVNTSRQEAYAAMLGRGFQLNVLGIAMHLPNEPGFSRPGVYVLDDWR